MGDTKATLLWSWSPWYLLLRFQLLCFRMGFLQTFHILLWFQLLRFWAGFFQTFHIFLEQVYGL